jgi:hypothetical protein
MNNNYIDLVENDSTLSLIPDANYPLDADEIEFLRSQSHDSAMYELLESYFCNGWESHTGNVALFSGMVIESPDGKIYCDNYYAVKSALDALLNGETYTLYLVN